MSLAISHHPVAIMSTLRANVDRRQYHYELSTFGLLDGVALVKQLALRWVDTLRRLLLVLCRAISPSEPHVATQLAAGARPDSWPTTPAADVAARKRLSAQYGPPLRALLLLIEPEKWKLYAQLSAVAAGVPAANALVLMYAQLPALQPRPSSRVRPASRVSAWPCVLL